MSLQPFPPQAMYSALHYFPLCLVESEVFNPVQYCGLHYVTQTSVLHSCLHSRHCLAHVFVFLICYRQLSKERRNIEE